MRVANRAAKFAQADELRCCRPNASCSWNEYQTACTAGQKKKIERDRDLRREQRVRQPRRAEDDPLFHSPGLSAFLLAASNLRRMSLPRRTASSIAVLASFLPANTASISSSITSRPCT